MKTILMFAHDDKGQEARLQASLDLARATGAHLTFIDVAILPSVVSDYVLTTMTTAMVEDEVAAEQQNRARIEERLAGQDIPFDWVETSGEASVCLANTNRMGDVMVVNRDLGTSSAPDAKGIVAELVRHSRLPVLAVPGDLRAFDVYGHVLVAWDGSPDAEAALRAALPMLKHAGSVTLLYVEDRSMKIPIAEAARWLSRHGIHATIREELLLKERPASILLSAIRTLDAAYLVMGGYSRSPLIEAAFGGTTQRLLKESPVPLFIGHR